MFHAVFSKLINHGKKGEKNILVELIHPKTNETVKIEIDKLSMEQFEELLKPSASRSKLLSSIDNFAIAAEMKAMLSAIIDVTVKVGKTIIKIGMKIIQFIIDFVKSYPHTAVGLLVGTLIGFLFDSIPILGWLLGWLIQPICMLLGTAIGFWQDIKDDKLKNNIKTTVNEMFSVLKNIPVQA